MMTVLALVLPGLPFGFFLGILWAGYVYKQERSVRMLTCCCCGIALEFADAEPVLVGIDGHDDVMCRRCFREDCDCLDDLGSYALADGYEPMFYDGVSHADDAL